MSSSTVARARVLRGPLAGAVRGADMHADLTVLVPPVTTDDHEEPAVVSEEFITAREQAARVGYEDGFEAGWREASEQAHAQVAAHAAQLAEALAALDAATNALAERQSFVVADVEQQMTTMALQIAEAIVGRELHTAHDPGVEAISRALRLAPKRADAIAHLNPGDVATLGDLAALAGDRNVTVVADAAVEPGGCVLDVGACRIDAQVGPALARVREALGA